MYDVQGLFTETKVKWYIIQTYIGFEDAVRKNLETKVTNLDIDNKIQEIYIPTKILNKKSKKGDIVEKIVKIYPGYIYIKCILNQEVGYLIQNTPYVSRIAGTGNYAVALEDGYVEKLKVKLAEESENKASFGIGDYHFGDLVRVVDGPFKDMQGKISGIDLNTNRVTILLTIFERESNVEVDVLEVEKVL